jgi:hypothetical protein
MKNITILNPIEIFFGQVNICGIEGYINYIEIESKQRTIAQISVTRAPTIGADFTVDLIDS